MLNFVLILFCLSYMPPGTPHYVVTIQRTILYGRQYFSTAMFTQHFSTLIFTTIINKYLSNTHHQHWTNWLRAIDKFWMIQYTSFITTSDTGKFFFQLLLKIIYSYIYSIFQYSRKNTERQINQSCSSFTHI